MRINLENFHHVTVYENVDNLEGTYYVNYYIDNGEGFLRRNTIASCLTEREAQSLAKHIEETAKLFKELTMASDKRESNLLNQDKIEYQASYHETF